MATVKDIPYNLAIAAGQSIRRNAGDTAYEAYTPSGGGGGSPGGSSGQLQYNNAGSFGGTAGIVYAASGSHLTVTAQAASDVPVVITGAASQSGNYVTVQTSASGEVFRVLASGRSVVGKNYSAALNQYHRLVVDMDTGASNFPTGLAVVGANATLYPGIEIARARGTAGSPTNIATGDILGELTFSGYSLSSVFAPGGGVRARANSDWSSVIDSATVLELRNTPTTGLTSPRTQITLQDWTVSLDPTASTTAIGSVLNGGRLVVRSQATTQTTLEMRAIASQTAEVIQIQNSSPATVWSVLPAGHTGIGAAASTANLMTVVIPSAAVLGLRIQGATSQSGDYIRLTNSAGTHLTSFNSNGYLGIGTAVASTTMVRLTIGTNTHHGLAVTAHASQNTGTELLLAQSSTSTQWFAVSGGGLTGIGQGYANSVQCHITGIAAGNVILRLRGHSSQTANYFQITTNGGTSLWGINVVGNTHVGAAATTGVMLNITPDAATTVGLRINEPTGGTAEFIQVFDDAAGTAFEVEQGGRTGVGRAATSTTMLDVQATTSNDTVLVLRGAASHAAPYFQVQTSAAAVILQIASTGTLTFGDGYNMTFNGTTGTKIGTSTSHKFAFWNATPIVQPASAAQAAVSLDTDVTGTETVDKTAINSNFTAIQTLLNEIRTVLVNVGLMKGAA